MNPKAEIFRKCFNGKMRTIPRFNEFNKVSNLFLFSYIQNTITTNAFKNKRYLMADNTIIKKSFNQEFLTCSFSLPHPSKADKGGEDCYFIYEDLLAVADGVGGWKELGVDPANYSKFLCDNLKNVYSIYNKEHEKEEQNESKVDEIKLKNFIIEAAKMTNLQGSSTLCAILIDNNKNCLYSAYIGDSVYMILRYKEGYYHKLFKSKDLTHKFNHPFQLGFKGDDPEKSILAKHDLEINDIIILGTDGLWDNVHDSEIENLLNESMNSYKELDEDFKNIKFLHNFTSTLSAKAVHNSFNKKFVSPFSLKARAFNQFKIGGKKDDITIIVAFIQQKTKRKNLKKYNKTIEIKNFLTNNLDYFTQDLMAKNFEKKALAD